MSLLFWCLCCSALCNYVVLLFCCLCCSAVLIFSFLCSSYFRLFCCPVFYCIFFLNKLFHYAIVLLFVCSIFLEVLALLFWFFFVHTIILIQNKIFLELYILLAQAIKQYIHIMSHFTVQHILYEVFETKLFSVDFSFQGNFLPLFQP